MLNLLFISSNPKAEYIKSVLQPLLKVIIDVVPDFDHGLKDVFEKRPATVCIQDQISGVTGESVARHIQMLLGTGAPNFILLHEGNAKAKPIKGLFEFSIDLGQPDEKLAEEIQNTLKSLLGDQWDKIYIPPKPSRASIRAAVLPEETREDAEKLVDDFLSDLEAGEFSFAEDVKPEQAVLTAEPEAMPTKSTADELADLLLQQAHETVMVSAAPAATVQAVAEQTEAADLEVPAVPATDENQRSPQAGKPRQRRQAKTAAAPAPPEVSAVAGETVATSSTPEPVPPGGAKPAIRQKPVEPQVQDAQQQAPVALSDFRIAAADDPGDEPFSEEFLLSLESGYTSRPSPWKGAVVSVAVLAAVVAGSAWYVKGYKPELWQRAISLVSPAKEKTAHPAAPQPGNVTQGSKAPAPVPAGMPAAAAAPAALPAFVPASGRDSSYATQKPGWERYVGSDAEFRLYRSEGKLKAVQVIAAKDHVIDKAKIAAILKELTGNAEYRVSSEETRSGLRLRHGMVGERAELLMYMSRDAVRAMVISLN